MERPLTQYIHPNGAPRLLREYVKDGGYRSLHTLAAGMAPQDLQRLVAEAGLRGRGGAGFPTGSKWSFV
ncbi:MAG TPA: NADH-quinone oxidoreductase subunit F, partial [Nitrospira sp.]